MYAFEEEWEVFEEDHQKANWEIPSVEGYELRKDELSNWCVVSVY